jgi:replication fork protection complex subunit Tof1/Swi1
VKPDNEERRIAMFKDNKLRLLLTLVGFLRLGEPHDPEASWIIPSSMSSSDLTSAADLIRKFEFDLPEYEEGKSAVDYLRSKAAAMRSSRRAEYDDDSDGVGNDSQEDRGEYALDEPTARGAPARKKLSRRRRRSRTPQELDDEERDRRADARRMKELEKQANVKSTIFVHDSDDEWEYNPERDSDKEFFAKEEAIRQSTKDQFLKSVALGSADLASTKKRKADEETSNGRKKRKSVEPDEGNDAISLSSRSPSPEHMELDSEDEEDEAIDTPISSQHAGPAKTSSVSAPVGSKGATVTNGNSDDDEEDEDDMPVVRKGPVRRAGFIIDSDSE